MIGATPLSTACQCSRSSRALASWLRRLLFPCHLVLRRALGISSSYAGISSGWRDNADIPLETFLTAEGRSRTVGDESARRDKPAPGIAGEIQTQHGRHYRCPCVRRRPASPPSAARGLRLLDALRRWGFYRSRTAQDRTRLFRRWRGASICRVGEGPDESQDDAIRTSRW